MPMPADSSLIAAAPRNTAPPRDFGAVWRPSAVGRSSPLPGENSPVPSHWTHSSPHDAGSSYRSRFCNARATSESCPDSKSAFLQPRDAAMVAHAWKHLSILDSRQDRLPAVISRTVDHRHTNSHLSPRRYYTAVGLSVIIGGFGCLANFMLPEFCSNNRYVANHRHRHCHQQSGE